MTWLRYDDTDLPGRYDESRKFPEETLRMWLSAVSDYLPRRAVHTILDVGCGTGRFAQPLAEHFDAQVIGIDPSAKMLNVARRAIGSPRVRLVRATAEQIPMRSAAVDVAFMSQVYHHLVDRPKAAREFKRVLKPGGHLCIRISTKGLMNSWLYARFFPEAKAMALARLPSRIEVKNLFVDTGFDVVVERTISQLWARDHAEYYEKLRLRGTSDLASITDEQFEQGLARLKAYCESHVTGGPIYEDIDLLVFRRPQNAIIEVYEVTHGRGEEQ